MVLETSNKMEHAIRLYKRNGFEEYLSDHLSCSCDYALHLNLRTPSPD